MYSRLGLGLNLGESMDSWNDVFIAIFLPLIFGDGNHITMDLAQQLSSLNRMGAIE